MRPQRKHAHTAPRPVFTFVCTACETVEHRLTPALPEGWAVEEIGNDLYAYCPDHAADLPRADVIRGPFQ